MQPRPPLQSQPAPQPKGVFYSNRDGRPRTLLAARLKSLANTFTQQLRWTKGDAAVISIVLLSTVPFWITTRVATPKVPANNQLVR